MKKFVFLVTNGDDYQIKFEWGESILEARKYLSLHKAWTVVGDCEKIKSFIAEKRQDEAPLNMSEWLRKHWYEYDGNLDILEAQLASA